MPEDKENLRDYLEKKFGGVYARIHDLREEMQSVKIDAVKLNSDFTNHQKSNIHHHTPCESSKGIEKKLSGYNKLVWGVLITILVSAGGVIAVLIGK